MQLAHAERYKTYWCHSRIYSSFSTDSQAEDKENMQKTRKYLPRAHIVATATMRQKICEQKMNPKSSDRASYRCVHINLDLNNARRVYILVILFLMSFMN